MSQSLHRIAAAIVLAALAGCQSVGNGRAFEQSAADRARMLSPGVTTRDQVRHDLGEATIYRFADGRESWSYQTTAGIPKWVQSVPYLSLLPMDYASRTNELALLFDAQGVLRKVEWRARQGAT